MTTDAPSRASARAIANPIPAVDPVTRVFFPSNCKFIGRSFLYSFRAYRENKNSQARLWPARLHKNRWRSDRVHDFKRPDRRRSEEHTSELQSPDHLVCRLLLEKKKKK